MTDDQLVERDIFAFKTYTHLFFRCAQENIRHQLAVVTGFDPDIFKSHFAVEFDRKRSDIAAVVTGDQTHQIEPGRQRQSIFGSFVVSQSHTGSDREERSFAEVRVPGRELAPAGNHTGELFIDRRTLERHHVVALPAGHFNKLGVAAESFGRIGKTYGMTEIVAMRAA